MNGYDFDKTIYEKDSFSQFYGYVLLRRLYLILLLPYQAVLFLLWGVKILNRRQFKQAFSSYLIFTFGKEKLVENFWKKNERGIKEWYLKQQKEDDIIISASPEFFLKPIMEKLNIKEYMGTRMNPLNGKINGENCYGEEKVSRYLEKHQEEELKAFYSDSLSDLPMMKLAKEGFLVKGNIIEKYE